jgi:hypothetical protein
MKPAQKYFVAIHSLCHRRALPLQARLNASTIEEAIDRFPAAMEVKCPDD